MYLTNKMLSTRFLCKSVQTHWIKKTSKSFSTDANAVTFKVKGENN